jgi:hypothetical protein
VAESRREVLRRQLNQAFFRRVFICDGEVSGVEFADPYASLFAPELPGLLGKAAPQRGNKNGSV